jgi:hypothetical protein
MTEKMLEEILQTEESETKVLEAVAQYRSEHYHKGEDKQLICNLLCAALRATRDQHDLTSLTYQDISQDQSRVIATYDGGGSMTVNVSLDSGIAMIRDILRAIS